MERGSNRHAVTQQRLARGSKGQQSQSSRRRPDAAGGKAFRRFLAHFCCCLFFPLGFKFCCIVLRVANARDLIIDLRRLCYLQWITTQIDSDNWTVIRVRPYNFCTLSFLWVTAVKATAWCRVLIAQFGINFDAALVTVVGGVVRLPSDSVAQGRRSLEVGRHAGRPLRSLSLTDRD